MLNLAPWSMREEENTVLFIHHSISSMSLNLSQSIPLTQNQSKSNIIKKIQSEGERKERNTTKISRWYSDARLSMAISSPKAAALPSRLSSMLMRPSSAYINVMISWTSLASPAIDMYLAHASPLSTAMHRSLYTVSAALSLKKLEKSLKKNICEMK